MEYASDIEFIPGVGIRTTRRASGSRNDILALSWQHYAGGWTARASQDGDSPVYRMIASVEGDPNDPNADKQNTHELHGNVLSRGIFGCKALQDKFVTTEKAAAFTLITRLYNDLLAGKMDYDTAIAKIGEGGGGNPFDDEDLLLAAEVLDEMLTGLDHVNVFSYAYRHTFNFGPLASAITNFGNVGHYYTLSELRNEEGIPSTFNLPEGEWLKIFPVATQMLGQRKQLTYEYWWAETWSRKVYLPKV